MAPPASELPHVLKEEYSTKRLRSVFESLQMQEPLPEYPVSLANVQQQIPDCY